MHVKQLSHPILLDRKFYTRGNRFHLVTEITVTPPHLNKCYKRTITERT